ncbi:hypothetical protein FQ142_14020 [Microbacterium sp. ANT_H45B]|uniref:hypothetical protein n=1 Tax=Microbacterium sp. ANT_H45B TaxID=2597346 RepID=UPI0011EC3D17|nr:hypothetical protein [Microbacterium sp. ANT_H45B]KAA0959975.1 hypothetical protein FQ142_14020 [Microbacterium sp. ANT_H45B]
MTLASLTPDAAAALSVQTLGMDPELVGLSSPEGLAASLRRAASFMCPTSPSRLIDAALNAVGPVSDGELSRDEIADLLNLLIASGDLLELRQELHGRSVRLIYLGPPSYLERAPGTYMLLGVRPFGAWLLDSKWAAEIIREGHTRVIELAPATAIEVFKAAGLQRLDRQRWVASPRMETAADVIRRTAERLDVAGRGGEIEGLQILDPAKPVRYYRGRWREPNATDRGDFIARRAQAYGADLWSAVRLEDGVATRIFQFPADDPVVPARDEAWRFQMAIDAGRGGPQRYAIEPGASGSSVVKFFSPIPGFAERYLQLIGMPLAGTSGALFAFRVPPGAMPDLIQLLTDLLWMEPVPKETK